MEGVAFKKHKDTLAYFNKNYVATEIFPRNLGRKFQAGGRADRPAFYYSIKMNIKRLYVSVLTIMRLNAYNRHTVKQE